jgi:hypothetical protein
MLPTVGDLESRTLPVTGANTGIDAIAAQTGDGQL